MITNNTAKKIAVLGAGSWGTALAITLAKNQHQVNLWGIDPQQMHQLAATRMNQRFLPDCQLPENIYPTSDLAAALTDIEFPLICVPSEAFKEILLKIKQLNPQATWPLVWATKGLEPGTGKFLHEAAWEVFAPDYPLAVLTGPSFAREVAAGQPTAIVVAAFEQKVADHVAKFFHSEIFRVYTQTDLIGAELGGAIKNVLAFAIGVAEGLGLGANARAGLITRGLAEMLKLGQAVGAKTETLIGLSGLGDLVLTATDRQSRNLRYGIAIGQGIAPKIAQANIGQVIESITTAQQVYTLAQSYKVELPISNQVYAIIHQHKSPQLALAELLGRSPKAE